MPTKKEGTPQEAPEEVSVAGISAPHISRVDQGFSGNVLLPPSGAPGAKMVKVKEVATGRVQGAWAVDAREMINVGSHTYADAGDELHSLDGQFSDSSRTVPADAGTPVTIDPVPNTGPAPVVNAQAEALEDMSKAELVALAGKAGVASEGTKAELVASLQPHVDAGTIALKKPATV